MKNFKKFTTYDESIKTTTSDKTHLIDFCRDTDNLPTGKQLRKTAKEYDRSAHAGHYAGEDPSYHWLAGAEHILRKLKKP